MEAYYLEIRAVHAAALASGGFYLMRALALNLLAASWPLSILARLASYSIDTVLITAALMLTVVTRHYPFVDPWLTMKVAVMLPLYLSRVLGASGEGVEVAVGCDGRRDRGLSLHL